MINLKEEGTDPSRIQIEITEGILLDTSTDVARVLAELRSRGIRIALDDFGTGYASVQYLSRYPVDKIKIYRSFVQAIGETGASGPILKAMIDLASALGISTTAEGVETSHQQRQLADLECGELQGVLLLKPIDADALCSLVTDHPARSIAA